MTISQFINYIYDLARKEGKGNVVSPAVIVNWLTFVMLDNFNELFTQAKTLAEQHNVGLANVIFDIKDLRQFVKTIPLTIGIQNNFGTYTTNLLKLPDDFKFELGATSDMVNLELLSSTLLPKYRGSALNGNPEESPKGFVSGGYLETIPNDAQNVVLTYLRTPAKPYYDFCMDSSDNEIFMPAGWYIIWVVNHFRLCDDSGNVIANDVTHPSATAGSTYYSQTVELDWDETNHVRFANVVAHKLGINLKNPILTQTQ